jgi:hypothetical protein
MIKFGPRIFKKFISSCNFHLASSGSTCGVCYLYALLPDNNSDELDFFSSVVARDGDCADGSTLSELNSFKCQSAANSDGNCAFWRPLCPDEYVSLSDVVKDNQGCIEGDTVDYTTVDTHFDAFTIVLWWGLIGENSCGTQKMLITKDKYLRLEMAIKAFESFKLTVPNLVLLLLKDALQFRLSNVPSALVRESVEVLTLSNPSLIEQKMTFTLQRGLQFTLTTADTVSNEFRADFSQKISSGAEGSVTSETSLSFGFTSLTSSTVTNSDGMSPHRRRRSKLPSLR